jgi:hypothetical protein
MAHLRHWRRDIDGSDEVYDDTLQGKILVFFKSNQFSTHRRASAKQTLAIILCIHSS